MSDIIMSDKTFEIESEFSPQGDQPATIQELVKGVQEGRDTRRFWVQRVRVRRLPLHRLLPSYSGPR